jgi:type II secretory pathway pseudopilin PulG
MLTLRRQKRRAFTLVEAMVSTTITVIAGSAVLLGIASSIKTTDDVLSRTQAGGMASLLMDEIAGQLYCQNPASPYEYPLGAPGIDRDQYDDIDDYEGFLSQPPRDRFDFPLGTEDRQGGQRDPSFRIDPNYFANWEQKVSVYYVDANDPSQPLSPGLTSAFRAVDVNINYKDASQATRPLAGLRRVFTYVPID